MFDVVQKIKKLCLKIMNDKVDMFSNLSSVFRI